MQRLAAFFSAIFGIALLAGCASVPRSGGTDDRSQIEATLARHISVLASDEFGGRRPGTDGELLTLRYLVREWQAAGLVSGTNIPGSDWYQPVELALAKPVTGTLALVEGKRRRPFEPDHAAVFTSARQAILEDAPLLFVGRRADFGPEIDLAGKVAVMLADHPARFEQRDALLAAGAAGVLAVVDTPGELAALAERRRAGNYRLASDRGDEVDGLVTAEAMARALGAARYEALFDAAAEAEFAPVPLKPRIDIAATSELADVQTHNLVAKISGTMPEAGAVLLLAHWDHFGNCVEGSADAPAADAICNGAVDNASGLAMLTELARRLRVKGPHDRDIYVLATTAEEWGLLGARAFARDPPLPLEDVVAAFNLDTSAVAPAGGPVAIIGAGRTNLDTVVRAAIERSGRRVADPRDAAQFLRRQDGWALLQRDVPALMVSSSFGDEEAMGRYLAERYHLPEDEGGDIELGGAAQDLLLHEELVRHFASILRWPVGQAAR